MCLSVCVCVPRKQTKKIFPMNFYLFLNFCLLATNQSSQEFTLTSPSTSSFLLPFSTTTTTKNYPTNQIGFPSKQIFFFYRRKRKIKTAKPNIEVELINFVRIFHFRCSPEEGKKSRTFSVWAIDYGQWSQYSLRRTSHSGNSKTLNYWNGMCGIQFVARIPVVLWLLARTPQHYFTV